MKLSNFQQIVDSSDESLVMISYSTDSGTTFQSKAISVADFVDDIGLEDLENVRAEVTPQTGDVLTWDGENWAAAAPTGGGGGGEQSDALAKGASLALAQALLASAGQPALTVLAVAATTTGKVQGVSLGDGNVIEVYASGADYNASNVLYREFMSLGEPICFTGLTAGAIITATQGFYGCGDQVQGNHESPMPLMSLGLAFTNTFVYAFRNSNNFPGTDNNTGQMIICAGALPTEVTLSRKSNGSINVVRGQENIKLQPFELTWLYTEANGEYIITATNPVMGAIQALMGSAPYGYGGTGAGNGSQRFYDARLIMPLLGDGITWPRSGNVSAPYDNTLVNYWVRDGASGNFTVNPGSPVDFDGSAGTGANDADYEPNGATRVKVVGLISAYSGADSSGLEASPLMPTSGMSQVVAQPFFIAENGDGGNSGVAIASPYKGTAKVFEWNAATGVAELAYTVPLTRGAGGSGITVNTPADQNFPCSGMVAREPGLDADPSVIQISGTLAPGYVIADVPITVVAQNGDVAGMASNEIRSQNGTTSRVIACDDDETLMLGWTPAELKTEITTDLNGFLRKRVIDGTGTESWELT